MDPTIDPLQGMETANGREEELSRVKKLEDLFDTKFVNPFGTNNQEIFEENLNHMDYASMQTMAVRIGLNSYLTKPRLKDALLRAFAVDCRERQSVPHMVQSKTRQLDPSDPKDRKLMLDLGMRV